MRKSPPPHPPIKRRILIVDSHPLVRRGLVALIDGESDLTVCAAVAEDQAGLKAIASVHPDLVITDISLERSNAFGLVSDIHKDHAGLPIMVLSLADAPQFVERAFRAGASGYFTKDEIGETVVSGIRHLLDGETCVSPKIKMPPGDQDAEE